MQDHLSALETVLSPADAYYNQRTALAQSSDRLNKLREAINDPINLFSTQWAHWFTYALDYKPDLILELGRGAGNSTCVFAEAIHQNQHGRLVSFCLTDFWQKKRLRP